DSQEYELHNALLNSKRLQLDALAHKFCSYDKLFHFICTRMKFLICENKSALETVLQCLIMKTISKNGKAKESQSIYICFSRLLSNDLRTMIYVSQTLSSTEDE